MKKIIRPLGIVVLMWFVFILQSIGFDLTQYGIYPRHLSGLIGIIASPFLHGDFAHITSNSLPMLVLGVVLYVFYPKIADKVLVLSIIIGGALVWLFARSAIHIGASGLVFALLGFILASGFFRKSFKSIIIAVVIFILYGGIIWGVLPTNPHVSFEAHLFGFITGIYLAYLFKDYTVKNIDEEDVEIIYVE